MKSAYELAMSRLEKADPVRKLSEDQKLRIREIDSECDAKIAEKRIFLETEIVKAAGDPFTIDSLRAQLASEIASVEEKRESRKEKIRQEN